MKKPRVLLHLAALAMGLCLLAGCAAQPAAPQNRAVPMAGGKTAKQSIAR